MPLEHVDARIMFAIAALDSPLLPYRWGGEAASEGGYDCSGRVCRSLTFTARCYPLLYDGARRTAAGLMSYYVGLGCRVIEDPRDLVPGCLTFHAVSSAKPPHHVRIHLATLPAFRTGPRGTIVEEPVGPLAVESAGAGSDATSWRAAAMRGAGFQVVASDRPSGTWWRALDPFEVLG